MSTDQRLLLVLAAFIYMKLCISVKEEYLNQICLTSEVKVMTRFGEVL